MDVVKVNLLMIIVNDEFQEEMLELLGENDYMATMVASTGEFLQYGNTTFILGVDDEETDKLVQLIDKKTSKNRNQYEDSIGVKDIHNRKNIATIFIMKSEQFIKTQTKWNLRFLFASDLYNDHQF